MPNNRNIKSNQLYEFIIAELKSGKPFPSHASMKACVGNNYANAVMDLVLTGRLLRDRAKHTRQKYAYRLAP